MGGQLVVIGGPGSLQVDVLPEVGDRPTDVVHNEKGYTCGIQRGRVGHELCHVVGGLLMPAAANSAGLYQIVFLLAALNHTP